jgi:low temperature requirement protein LtrA
MSVSGQAASARSDGAQRVSWLELFYDLVFVAAVITFSDAVSATPDAETILLSVGAYAIAWWIWLTTTLFANRFARDDMLQRALILVQMLLLTVMAIAVGDGIDEHPGLAAFLVALLCLDVAAMHARETGRAEPLGALATSRRNEYVLAAIPLFVAAAVHGPARWVLWPAAAAVIVVPGLAYRLGRRPGEAPIRDGHLVERFGLLTILMLGEAFVKVALVASDGTLDDIDLFVLPTLFVVIFAIWWGYFDDVPNAGLPSETGKLAGWFAGHLWLQVFIVGIAVGYSKLLRLDLGESIVLDRMLLIVGPMIGVYLSMAAIGACTRRRPVGPLLALRLGSAVVLVPLGIVIWQSSWITVDVAASVLAVYSLAHSSLAALLRRDTRVLGA